MVFLPKTHYLHLIMTQTSAKSQLKGILQSTWPALFRTLKVTENKEHLRNSHSHQEPKRHDKQMSCDVLELEKETRSKLKHWNKTCYFVNTNTSTMFISCDKCTLLM